MSESPPESPRARAAALVDHPLVRGARARFREDWATPTILIVFGVLSLVLLVVMYPAYALKRHEVPSSALWRAQRYEDARPHLEALVRHYRGEAEKLEQREGYADNPKYRNTLRKYRRYLRWLGTSYLWAGQPERALKTWEHLREVQPGVKLEAELAMCLMELERYDEARPNLEAALRRKPGDPALNYYKGVLHLRDGEYQPAGRAFLIAATDKRWDERARPYRERLAREVFGEGGVPDFPEPTPTPDPTPDTVK